MLVLMKLRRSLARAAATASAVLVLAACNQGAPGCTAVPVVANGPTAVNATLISPAPGATGVSTGPLDVTIGSAISVVGLYLQDGSGNVTSATNFRQANPPSNDVRIGTFPQLASQTTYQVYASVIGPSPPFNPCANTPAITPVLAPQLLGSFTTR
jgi:hypothetical protein